MKAASRDGPLVAGYGRSPPQASGHWPTRNRSLLGEANRLKAVAPVDEVIRKMGSAHA